MRKKGKRKMHIWIFIAIAVVVITTILIIMYPMLSMKPAETGEVAETDIIAIRNASNDIYILKTQNGFVLIDAGSDKVELEKALNQLSIDPMKVSHVFLTHVDSDHVNGLNLFPDAQVYISEDEMQMLDGSVKRNRNRYCALPDGFDSRRLVTLTDGQELLVDDFSIVCIKSAGHTLGSMSFFVDKAYLFTGDALHVQGDKILVSPFSMDEDKSKTTISRLYELMDECQFVLTAHYGYHRADRLQIGWEK